MDDALLEELTSPQESEKLDAADNRELEVDAVLSALMEMTVSDILFDNTKPLGCEEGQKVYTLISRLLNQLYLSCHLTIPIERKLLEGDFPSIVGDGVLVTLINASDIIPLLLIDGWFGVKKIALKNSADLSKRDACYCIKVAYEQIIIIFHAFSLQLKDSFPKGKESFFKVLQKKLFSRGSRSLLTCRFEKLELFDIEIPFNGFKSYADILQYLFDISESFFEIVIAKTGKLYKKLWKQKACKERAARIRKTLKHRGFDSFELGVLLSGKHQ